MFQAPQQTRSRIQLPFARRLAGNLRTMRSGLTSGEAFGSDPSSVRALQRILNYRNGGGRGFRGSLPVNGRFDEATQAALQGLQSELGTPATGSFDARTFNALARDFGMDRQGAQPSFTPGRRHTTDPESLNSLSTPNIQRRAGFRRISQDAEHQGQLQIAYGRHLRGLSNLDIGETGTFTARHSGGLERTFEVTRTGVGADEFSFRRFQETRPESPSASPTTDTTTSRAPSSYPGVSSTLLRRAQDFVNSPFGEAAIEAARREGLRPELLLGLIGAESGFNQNARSGVGAFGFTQLMPGTAGDLGVNRNDPFQNIAGGARYLSQQLARFGREDYALGGYNAGPGRIDQYNGLPPFAETQAYVPRVLAYAEAFRQFL